MFKRHKSSKQSNQSIVMTFSPSYRAGSSGGRVVKLLACGARGPGFDSRPRHLNFQKLVISCFLVEIWLKDCWIDVHPQKTINQQTIELKLLPNCAIIEVMSHYLEVWATVSRHILDNLNILQGRYPLRLCLWMTVKEPQCTACR